MHGRQHEHKKEACPAYGKQCRASDNQNHFESVCKSSASGGKKQVCDVSDDELLSATSGERERYYTRLSIDVRSYEFMVDCGTTVNLIPLAVISDLGRSAEIRRAPTAIRMFDRTALEISGVINLAARCPCESQSYDFVFLSYRVA